MNRKLVFPLLGIVFLLMGYVLISLITMDGEFILRHPYAYESEEEATRKEALIQSDIPFQMSGFSPEKEKAIRENIKIWASKSMYQEFWGFIMHLDKENQSSKRINIEVLDEKGYEKLFTGVILYRQRKVGHIFGASFEVPANEKKIELIVNELQSGDWVEVGRIEILSDKKVSTESVVFSSKSTKAAILGSFCLFLFSREAKGQFT